MYKKIGSSGEFVGVKSGPGAWSGVTAVLESEAVGHPRALNRPPGGRAAQMLNIGGRCTTIVSFVVGAR